MGAFAGPEIVEDGLILSLDARNTKSYSGSGTTWTDLSGTQNNGILRNGALYSTFGGGSIEFDGSNDYVDLNKHYTGSGEIAKGEANGNYTLIAWIYVRSSSGTTTNAHSIVGNTSSRGVGMQVGVSGGKPRINYGARSTSNFYSSTFEYNTWMHIALSRIGGTSVRSYLNGNFDTSTSVGNLEVDSGHAIGEMRIGNSSSRISGYFDGYISMVKIYNVGLTDDEVKRNFNASRGRFGI